MLIPLNTTRLRSFGEMITMPSDSFMTSSLTENTSSCLIPCLREFVCGQLAEETEVTSLACHQYIGAVARYVSVILSLKEQCTH